MRTRTRFEKPKVFAVWHPSEAIRLTSSSGGAFTMLAEATIKRGGVVFGAAWNEKNQVVIESADTYDDLAKLRESKYVAAIVGDEYSRAKILLDSGREVLYSGTPCQIAGLYAFLNGREYKNLTTVDFICHGTPDSRVWEKYLSNLEYKFNDKIGDVHFRDKRWGVECGLLLTLILQNRRVNKIISGGCNTYYYGFKQRIIIRRACLKCRLNSFPRQADFSLADFRGLGERKTFSFEYEKTKGFSGVLVNSPHAEAFLNLLDLRTWVERPFEEFTDSQQRLIDSCVVPQYYEQFWKDFDSKEWSELERKYLKPSRKYRAYIITRRILGPQIFLRLGTIYKKLRGFRTTTWQPCKGE